MPLQKNKPPTNGLYPAFLNSVLVKYTCTRRSLKVVFPESEASWKKKVFTPAFRPIPPRSSHFWIRLCGSGHPVRVSVACPPSRARCIYVVDTLCYSVLIPNTVPACPRKRGPSVPRYFKSFLWRHPRLKTLEITQ